MAVGAWRHPWPRIMRNTAIELDRAGRAVSRVPYVHSSARPGRSSSIVELRMLRAASRHASARPAPRSGHRLLSGRRPRSLRCPPFPSPGSARSPPATLAQVPAFPLGRCARSPPSTLPQVPAFPSLGARARGPPSRLPQMPAFPVAGRFARGPPATLPQVPAFPVVGRFARGPPARLPQMPAFPQRPPSRMKPPNPSTGPRHRHHPTLATQLAQSCSRAETNVPCSVAGDGSSVPVPSATRLTVVDQSA